MCDMMSCHIGWCHNWIFNQRMDNYVFRLYIAQRRRKVLSSGGDRITAWGLGCCNPPPVVSGESPGGGPGSKPSEAQRFAQIQPDCKPSKLVVLQCPKYHFLWLTNWNVLLKVGIIHKKLLTQAEAYLKPGIRNILEDPLRHISYQALLC